MSRPRKASPPSLRRTWGKLGISADYTKRRQMPLQREARALISVGPAADGGKAVRLAPRAAVAWNRMQAAARREGIKLLLISGFRSTARQTRIIREKLGAGERINQILRFVAAPGCSEHHTGRALDVGSPGNPRLDEDFAKTAEFRWLRKHAASFGFHLSYPRKNLHGIGFEPWHWCWQNRFTKP